MVDITKKVNQHELWKGVSERELEFTVRMLERGIMGTLFDSLFQVNSEEAELRKQLDIFREKLTLTDFEIPIKFHSEAPWPLAQEELRRIDSYRAPYDKFLCISRCWEIISNYVCLLDDPAPDALWPIMAWCLQSMDKILSNLQYITDYTSSLSDYEEARLQAFNTAIEILKDTLVHKRGKVEISK